MRLVELRDGRLVGETDALPVSAPAAPAGDPETALAAALARIAERVPDARAGLAIAPFANGRTGVVTSAGIYLAGLARDAWLAAADTPTAAIRGAAQPAARMNAAPTEGFTLSGTIWLIDASRSGLHLVLAENGIDRASERLEIATLRLPHRVRAMLDPAGLETGRGFAPLRAALAGLGRERLEMVISRGPNPAYRVCADTSPDSVAGCDRLEFALRAGRAGHALCAALGDDGAFGLLAPAAHFRAPAIGPDRWTMLPQDLPPASGGGRVVWPALGDPGATLVLCALFEAEGLMPLAALTPFDGQSLAPEDVAAVAEVLRDASPLSTAHAIVTLIADDLD